MSDCTQWSYAKACAFMMESLSTEFYLEGDFEALSIFMKECEECFFEVFMQMSLENELRKGTSPTQCLKYLVIYSILGCRYYDSFEESIITIARKLIELGAVFPLGTIMRQGALYKRGKEIHDKFVRKPAYGLFYNVMASFVTNLDLKVNYKKWDSLKLYSDFELDCIDDDENMSVQDRMRLLKTNVENRSRLVESCKWSTKENQDEFVQKFKNFLKQYNSD